MAFIRWKASISCGKWERNARISFKNRIVWRYLTDAIWTFALMSNGRSISGSGRPYLRRWEAELSYLMVCMRQNQGNENPIVAGSRPQGLWFELPVLWLNYDRHLSWFSMCSAQGLNTSVTSHWQATQYVYCWLPITSHSAHKRNRKSWQRNGFQMFTNLKTTITRL